MIVEQFKIRTSYTAPERWFWVRIYDTPEALRKVAQRVAPQTDYGNCFGTVQEITPWVPDDTDPEHQDDLPVSDLAFPLNGCAGVIRLCADWLLDSILAHEVLHAALVVFRMNICQRPQMEGLLSPIRDNEEALAYTVGDLSADLFRELRERIV